MSTFLERKVTPPEIAKAWGISLDKVLAFIRSGELVATNCATPGRNQRPRYLVSESAIADFEKRRAVVPPPPKSPRVRRKVQQRPDDRY